jgi:hypothetical protein
MAGRSLKDPSFNSNYRNKKGAKSTKKYSRDQRNYLEILHQQ